MSNTEAINLNDVVKTRKFTFIADSGHGWLEVPRSLLQTLGIEAQISGCSYQFSGLTYLEEDCDMPRFIQAFKAVYDTDPKIVDIEVNGRSIVRSYDRFSPIS